jgi:hypothetical protein
MVVAVDIDSSLFYLKLSSNAEREEDNAAINVPKSGMRRRYPPRIRRVDDIPPEPARGCVPRSSVLTTERAWAKVDVGLIG